MIGRWVSVRSCWRAAGGESGQCDGRHAQLLAHGAAKLRGSGRTPRRVLHAPPSLSAPPRSAGPPRGDAAGRIHWGVAGRQLRPAAEARRKPACSAAAACGRTGSARGREAALQSGAVNLRRRHPDEEDAVEPRVARQGSINRCRIQVHESSVRAAGRRSWPFRTRQQPGCHKSAQACPFRPFSFLTRLYQQIDAQSLEL